MSNTNPSANMNLPIPVVGTDAGPDWANNLNSCLTLVDAHDHSPGYGVAVTPNGLNINSDLPFGGNNLTLVRSLRFSSQNAVLSDPSDIGCVYEVGVDLYYNDGNGNQVRITQSGGVAGSPGSIANLASPASASYVSANQTFVWESDASTPANMDGGSVILRNITANSKGLTLSPPNAMGADYTVTLPSVPGSTSFMTIDTSGTIGAPYSTTQGIPKTALVPVGQQISSSCGNAISTSSSYADVTNLSVTITTTGRPVFIGLISDASGNSSNIGISTVTNADVISGQWAILRAASIISECNVFLNATPSSSILNSRVPSSSVHTIDVPAAGTYTYKIQQKIVSGGFVGVLYSKLIAYEL